MDYPANIDVQTPETFDRWRPIGQPVLAIPHLIISAAFNSLSGSIAVVSWFAIIFTGKLPEGLANLQVMLLRYSTRAELYAGFLYSAYPPFDFTVVANEPGGSPVLLDVRPELENRDRLRVGQDLLGHPGSTSTPYWASIFTRPTRRTDRFQLLACCLMSRHRCADQR